MDFALKCVCYIPYFIQIVVCRLCRSQWPRGLRRRSTVTRLLRVWVRIPPGAWMSVCCECCVLSGRGLCDVRITRPEVSYRVWCVVVCDLETSRMRPWPAAPQEKKVYIFTYKFICNIYFVGKPWRKQSVGRRSREW